MCQCCLLLLPLALFLSLLLHLCAAVRVITAPPPSTQRKYKAHVWHEAKKVSERERETVRVRERKKMAPNKVPAPLILFKESEESFHSRLTHH